MHRTESDNFIVVGGKNQHTNGPPGTTVDAVDINTTQEEIAYVIEQNGLTLKTVATETNTQLYEAIAAQITAGTTPVVDFESKNLLIDVASTTTVTVTGDRLSTLDSSYIPSFINDLNATFDITTDLMAGTSEKSSTWYWLWIDSAENILMIPDLTGTTDGTTAGKLVHSGADFVTDKVQIGDIVYNTTDLTQTTVTAIDDANTLSLSNDIFVSGEDYLIRILSPTGLGSSKSRVGAAYNNAASDLVSSKKNGKARITTARYHTLNGYGSSSTAILKFTTEVLAPDTDQVIYIVNSALLGLTITAITHCTLSIDISVNFDAAIVFGVSLNSTQLTTSIISITDSDIIQIAQTAGAGAYGTVHVSNLVLMPGDVVRPHAGGGAATAAVSSMIHITAKEII